MAGVSKSVVEWLRRTPADADGVAELLARVAVGPPVRRGDTLLTAPVIVAHCVLHHSFTFLDRDAHPLGSAAWKGGVCDVLHADGRPELSVRPIGSWRRFGGWAHDLSLAGDPTPITVKKPRWWSPIAVIAHGDTQVAVLHIEPKKPMGAMINDSTDTRRVARVRIASKTNTRDVAALVVEVDAGASLSAHGCAGRRGHGRQGNGELRHADGV